MMRTEKNKGNIITKMNLLFAHLAFKGYSFTFSKYILDYNKLFY
ncbi:hypothetical protein NTE_00519 [Candidatus Nitrososphaera evergladensis SR1]|uniref:Uncharacterized protein n=1 Tax=Candidatus Nitrososphaera evergladensis SR1 TaxID=1459636 RepID=A0A075MN71_9ARCH|nr:hypothetical protein NTE_00519 [Candidatus Nitrososphaera evergladensis SR1]